MKGSRKEETFAEGLCFYKLFWLFFTSAFLGDIIEVIFCRLTMGAFISRSSLVYGSFSIVWGLGCAGFTALLYKHRNKPLWVIFIEGAILGGIYEYLCSVFTEMVFGAVFWDYSAFTFNINGRVNILFCLYWGVAAVCWMGWLFPFLSRVIEAQKRRRAVILTWLMAAFMLFDILISAYALIRLRERQKGIPASGVIEEYFDEHFDNDYMINIYPKVKPAGK